MTESVTLWGMACNTSPDLENRVKETIKDVLWLRGMSIRAFADEKLKGRGPCLRNLYRILNGNSVLTVRTLSEIAMALEMRVSDLVKLAEGSSAD